MEKNEDRRRFGSEWKLSDRKTRISTFYEVRENLNYLPVVVVFKNEQQTSLCKLLTFRCVNYKRGKRTSAGKN